MPAQQRGVGPIRHWRPLVHKSDVRLPHRELRVGAQLMIRVKGYIGVRYVGLGDRFGRRDDFVNQLTPMVEFYDLRRRVAGEWKGRGQFIARLPIDLMWRPEVTAGIDLDKRVDAWTLGPEEVARVRNHL